MYIVKFKVPFILSTVEWKQAALLKSQLAEGWEISVFSVIDSKTAEWRVFFNMKLSRLRDSFMEQRFRVREREWVLSVFPWHVSSRSQAFAKPLRTLPYWLWNIWNAGVRTGPLVSCWSKMYKKGPLRQEVDQQRGVPEPWTKYKWNRGEESHFFFWNLSGVWILFLFHAGPTCTPLSVVGRTMPLVQMRHCPSSSWSSSVSWPRSCLHDVSPVEWICMCCFPSKKK